jgi:hypothetical protein
LEPGRLHICDRGDTHDNDLGNTQAAKIFLEVRVGEGSGRLFHDRVIGWLLV